MSFTSPLFLLLFLPLVITTYFVIPNKFKNLYLLLISYIFILILEKNYALLIFTMVLCNYVLGKLIEVFDKNNIGHLRNTIFIVALVFNIFLLVYYKYFALLLGTISQLVPIENSLSSETPIIPLGISFITFNNLSYLIDIYNRKSKAASFINGNLYSLFFPRVIAGPIEKYRDAHAQLINHSVTAEQFWYGTTRFIQGLAKKTLIANTLSGPVDQIFSLQANNITTPVAWFGIICYTLQIYFDFSGYSDMAIGLGNMFGFKFIENFNYPYISQSITEFWRRWHISLSTWLRDYLYIPLGGSQKGQVRTYVNVIIVFAICGLWHGPHWTFLVWGIWYGFFLVIEKWRLYSMLALIPRPFRHLYTLIVVILGWVLFKATSTGFALSYIRALLIFKADNSSSILVYVSNQILIVLCLAVILSVPISWASSIKNIILLGRNSLYRDDLLKVISFISLIAIFILSLMYIASDTYRPFIYSTF